MSKESFPYQRIYERDQYRCQYCGWSGASDFDKWFIANFSVDHIKPRSAGGTDDDSNLALACHSCNLYKGSIICESLEEAREVVKRKRAEAEVWYRKHVLKESDTETAVVAKAMSITSG